MLTGASPEVTGIVGNDFYNVAMAREEYCARDDAAPLMGVPLEGRSPRNLQTQTVGDLLKRADRQSRVVTVSGKDRSAIMLGGRTADAVYWMEDTLFVTSRYYTDALPDWVRAFNASGRAASYFHATWDRVVDAGEYAIQGADSVPWERDKAGMGRVFPHVLGRTESTPGSAFFDAFEYSPFQNEVVIEFAIEAVRNGRLGADAHPDLLGISLSGNDYVGHAFGPDSHEVMDVTIRTDRLLAKLFDFLDAEVGLENIVLVLTADHGVAPIPELVESQSPGAGALRIHDDVLADVAEHAMTERWGAPGRRWVVWRDRPYIYLDESEVRARGIALEDAEHTVRDALLGLDYVTNAWTHTELVAQRAQGVQTPVVKGFFPDRSGHVIYETRPWVVVTEDPDGTTHGTAWMYDRHVPLMWRGRGIAPGRYDDEVHVADLAPTLSALLGIPRPPAATGRVLTEMLAARR